MYILAIDTAGKTASVALANDNSIIARCGLNTGRTHSQKLLPMVDNLLKLAEIELADLSAVAVTIGPGSFTGLRIGMATAKAWSEVLNLPLVAVGTLEAAARAAGSDGYVCPIFDARKNQVYCALFKDGTEVWGAEALRLDELSERLLPLAAPILFCGDAVGVYDCQLAESLGSCFKTADEGKRFFLADGAVLLGRERFLSGKTISAEAIEPFYLRRSEAETKKMEAQKHD